MTGTATGTATAIGLLGSIVCKYGIRSDDLLVLWEDIRRKNEEAERLGFKEGFKMAQALSGFGSPVSAVFTMDPEEDEGEVQEYREQDQAFVRMEQGKHGKRLHFNKVAGGMFGTYRKADIYVRDGNLFIYPTNDGAYTVTRAGSAGHVQICCADILDELVTKSGNYPVEKRDNHIVARSPR